MIISISRGRTNWGVLLNSLAEFSEEINRVLGLSGYFFIAIHALAGLYHHYVVKDDTLKRMLP